VNIVRFTLQGQPATPIMCRFATLSQNLEKLNRKEMTLRNPRRGTKTARQAGRGPASMDSSVDCMAEIVPYNLPHFPHPCGSDAGGTSPWMGDGRTMQEQLPGATHGAVAERWNDEFTSYPRAPSLRPVAEFTLYLSAFVVHSFFRFSRTL
jgi:hypothetical protein